MFDPNDLTDITLPRLEKMRPALAGRVYAVRFLTSRQESQWRRDYKALADAPDPGAALAALLLSALSGWRQGDGPATPATADALDAEFTSIEQQVMAVDIPERIVAAQLDRLKNP